MGIDTGIASSVGFDGRRCMLLVVADSSMPFSLKLGQASKAPPCCGVEACEGLRLVMGDSACKGPLGLGTSSKSKLMGRLHLRDEVLPPYPGPG